MSMLPGDKQQRLIDLLADEQLGQLDVEARHELEALRREFAPHEHDLAPLWGELILAMDRASPGDHLPAPARARLVRSGLGFLAARDAARPRGPTGWRPAPWLALAASLAIVGVTLVAAALMVRSKNATLADSRERIAELMSRVASNEQLLASARGEVERLTRSAEDGATIIDEQRRALALAAEREVELAQRLASASSELEMAQLEIERYERPVDQDTLARNRTKLLEVPGTVRLAWQPFDLPESPALQRGVHGDVVWNDEIQQGYLRFIGLSVNDPAVEQYQVWLIDERGMEQKVGGGVFNASREGEIIVPIEPGIDVGRVALFAITVENPGGTWVPDLSRRVVVAPRDGA